MRKVTVINPIVCCLMAASLAMAVEVPSTAPRALKETQDPAVAAAHEKALAQETKSAEKDLVPGIWIEQIRQMAEQNSQREGQPAEKFDLILKKDGSLAHLSVAIARNAKRTPNKADQNHEICSATYDAKLGKLKLGPKDTAEGPDLYELFSIDQLATVCGELSAIRRLQHTFISAGLNYTLEANVIVAPDGKSWAWEIAPSEEQMPNVIYALYYYPITGELHSVVLDNKKAALKLEKAAKEAGMQLKWFKDMRER